MAFANLFKTLSTAEEDPAIPCQSHRPYRNGVQDLCATRRPHLGGQQTGQKKKKKKKKKKEKTHQHKQVNQANRTNTHGPTIYDYDNPDGDPRVPANFNHMSFRHSDKEQDLFNHSGAFFQRNMDKKVQHQKIQNMPTFKQEMQQQNMRQKKKKRQENPHSQRCANRRQWHQADHREGFPYKGRGPTKINEDNKQNPPAKRIRLMTQEFKDQNALEVDGRLLCKHFLRGRCTKGDECQLEHGNAVNNMIKEVCKFYIQGCCAKGESCAYMHSSFPCKYFHTWGKCSNEACCRFSHEPLTDLTKQLLDQALQRDKDLSELAKKSQQESLAQPVTTDLEVTAEEDASSPKPDILLHPIRLNFYNSSCPAEPHSETEELIGTEQDHDPKHITNTSLSHSPLSSDRCDFKAVSYSVEAVLGPMKSKPFPSLFGSNRDSTPSSSPPCSFVRPSVMANHVEASYSVDAVLGSVTTVGSSDLTHARDPPLSANLPLTYYGSDRSKEVPKPSRDSGMSNEKALCLQPDTVESKEAKARPNGSCVPSSNPDHEQANLHPSMNIIVPPDSQSSAEVNGVVIDSNSCTYNHVLPAQPETRTAKDAQKAFHSLFTCPLNQNVFKHPPHLRPLPSVAPSNPRHSTEKTASTDTATGHHNTQVLARSLTHKPAHRQSADFKVGNPGVPSGSKPQSTESPGRTRQPKTDRRPSKPAHCDQSVLGRSKPVKRPYHSSIVRSVMDRDEDLPPLQIATGLIMASSDSKEPSEVEPGKATGGVLQSLFATPIHETTASLPSAQGKPGTSKPRLVEGSSENHTKNSGALALATSSPGAKSPNRNWKSPRNNQQMPTDPIQNDSGLHCQRDSQMPEISSDKAPSNAATTTSNSVLKTLFLNLRPYCQEGEEQSGGKDETNRRSISKERQMTEEQKTNKKEMRKTEVLRGVEPSGCRVNPDHQATVIAQNSADATSLFLPQLQGSCEPTSQPTATAPAKHQPLVQIPHSHSSEPSGGHMSGSLPPVQLISLGAQHPPIGSKGPMTRPPSRPAQNSIKRPLKSLFKTLDPTASPFGS